MDAPMEIKRLQEEVQTALISTTRTVGEISSEDIDFQRSLDPEVADALDKQSARLLALSNALLRSAASLSSARVPNLKHVDDLENDWRGVVDVVDTLLEKSDICLDEFTGVRKYEKSQHNTVSKQKDSKTLGNAFRTQNIVKPQLAFEIKPDNTNTTEPWKPRLTSKPHATVPLQDALEIVADEHGPPHHKHPYETEIQQLQYPSTIYESREPIKYLPIDSSEVVFVDTYDGVLEMLDELKNAIEIAIDLEHHDTRTYTGLLSLMQISTRHKDWIIDTLKPWRHRLEILNEVFADPKIVKVLHGAFMDVVWLQRDLNLYVVGLFDTHHASRALGYAGGSLAFLLKKFIDFDADKKYQLADWRLRPLPTEMFYYARSDTHYLLYIYDCMRNELLDVDAKSGGHAQTMNIMNTVLEKSKDVSLLRYDEFVYDAESGHGSGGWFNLLLKWSTAMTNEQFAVFRAVHAWRDRFARLDDESPTFTMSNKTLINIAKIVPQDLMALHALCQPVNHDLRSRAKELLAVIQQAAATGKDGSSMMSVLRPEFSDVNSQKDLPGKQSDSKLVAVLAAQPLRSEVSAFWGATFGSSVWEPSRVQSSNRELCLAIPYTLPTMVEPSVGSIAANARNSVVIAEPQQPAVDAPSKSLDQTFTIKPGATARKRKSLHDEPSGVTANSKDVSSAGLGIFVNSTPDALPSELDVAPTEDIEMKDPLEQGAEEGIFDYAKATSVLHAKNDAPTKPHSSKKNKHGKAPFDPYGCKADELRGVSRSQTGRGGRSATFKR